MEIRFTGPAYDAFVTELEDRGIGAPSGYDVAIFLPAPDADADPVVFSLDSEGHPPPAALGSSLAAVLAGLAVDGALVVVRGVPLPEWATRFYVSLRTALGGAIGRLDLLGVDGYRWESLGLRADAAA